MSLYGSEADHTQHAHNQEVPIKGQRTVALKGKRSISIVLTFLKFNNSCYLSRWTKWRKSCWWIWKLGNWSQSASNAFLGQFEGPTLYTAHCITCTIFENITEYCMMLKPTTFHIRKSYKATISGPWTLLHLHPLLTKRFALRRRFCSLKGNWPNKNSFGAILIHSIAHMTPTDDSNPARGHIPYSSHDTH